MEIGIILAAIFFWAVSMLMLSIVEYDVLVKGVPKGLKTTGIACYIIVVVFSIFLTFIATDVNRSDAIIDYSEGKYIIETEIKSDTLKRVVKCPELYKPIVPSVIEPQHMKSIPPVDLEKQELRESLQPYSQLDSLN